MQEQLPGRLGDPSMTLLTDPRMDPRVVNLLAASGDLLDGIEPLESNASYEEALALCEQIESKIALAHPLAEAAMPDTVMSVSARRLFLVLMATRLRFTFTSR